MKALPNLVTGVRLALSLFVFFALATAAFAAQAPKMAEQEDPNAPVSYYKKIRPILQAEEDFLRATILVK